MEDDSRDFEWELRVNVDWNSFEKEMDEWMSNAIISSLYNCPFSAW
jgi:hypothetical protein